MFQNSETGFKKKDLLLTGCVPQAKIDSVAIYNHISTEVVENGWNIVLRDLPVHRFYVRSSSRGSMFNDLAINKLEKQRYKLKLQLGKCCWCKK